MNTQETNNHSGVNAHEKTHIQKAKEIAEALQLPQAKLEEKTDFFLEKLKMYIVGGLIAEAQQFAASDALDYFSHTFEHKQAIKMHLAQKISPVSGIPIEVLCIKPMHILLEMHEFLVQGNIEQILILAKKESPKKIGR